MNNDRRNKQASVMQQLAPYMMLGSQLAATILILGAVGWYADEYFDSTPLWLTVGLIAGSVIGFVQFFKSIQRLLKNNNSVSRKK